jgi:hypothetical protein
MDRSFVSIAMPSLVHVHLLASSLIAELCAETLNIFPSEPMHVVEPAPKVRTKKKRLATTTTCIGSRSSLHLDTFSHFPALIIYILIFRLIVSYFNYFKQESMGATTNNTAWNNAGAGPSKQPPSNLPSRTTATPAGPRKDGSKPPAAVKVSSVRSYLTVRMHTHTPASARVCLMTYVPIMHACHCRHQREGSSSGGAMGSGTPSTSNQQEGPTRTSDAKTLRRLAQNREAARKSRLRKKVRTRSERMHALA